ncbi:hypothetical protein, partial [Pseudomonas syringae]|uniref:hypothetical protein n=1 Tax=Pseudomonas syringae TaxID=317 RepID=UPI0034D547F6
HKGCQTQIQREKREKEKGKEPNTNNKLINPPQKKTSNSTTQTQVPKTTKRKQDSQHSNTNPCP